jgi:hypothetical protein
VRWVKYTYYTGETSPGVSDPNGRLGDLKLATVGQTVSGTDQILSQDYYRYYKFYTDSWNTTAGPTNNPATTGGGDTTFSSMSSLPCVYSGLKTAVEGVSYARLAAAIGGQSAIDAQSDSNVDPYANYTFRYESYTQSFLQGDDLGSTRYRVTTETAAAAGCSCTGNNGTGTIELSYTIRQAGNINDNLLDAPNTWVEKTIIVLPSDSSVHDEDIAYTNEIGQVLLSVVVDGSTGAAWATYYRYDDSGRLIFQANPSALAAYSASGYEQYLDLVNFGQTPSNINTDSGVIQITDYASGTTATATSAGSVAGYLEDREVQQGSEGTPVVLEAMTYYARTGNSTIYPLASDTVYGNADGTDPRTTTYSYTWYSGTDQMLTETMASPIVSAAQNGPGVADSQTSVKRL